MYTVQGHLQVWIYSLIWNIRDAPRVSLVLLFSGWYFFTLDLGTQVVWLNYGKCIFWLIFWVFWIGHWVYVCVNEGNLSDWFYKLFHCVRCVMISCLWEHELISVHLCGCHTYAYTYNCTEREKYRFVMTILDPTENYFHIDNKRISLITIKQVITSERSEWIPC